MAKNRMTFEKTQREAQKKRKAEEKRVLRRKKKEQSPLEPTGPEATDEAASEDDSAENGLAADVVNVRCDRC